MGLVSLAAAPYTAYAAEDMSGLPDIQFVSSSGNTSNQALFGKPNPSYDPSLPQHATNPVNYSDTGIAQGVLGPDCTTPGGIIQFSDHDTGVQELQFKAH
ncbi:hypothetical protein LSG31_02865 [Fodinisporobacter ferrooxydans]|uniref:Uncharacterized protein n=1 Tax=Fodinisporobacter ferrooxydans TaxID=2901836 RepID=A0ABY4CNT9_9BACL|nr:hypothetical protein LSG31_02865 [Alicyclobacillaceae bacterium MYW30-H2]